MTVASRALYVGLAAKAAWGKSGPGNRRDCGQNGPNMEACCQVDVNDCGQTVRSTVAGPRHGFDSSSLCESVGSRFSKPWQFDLGVQQKNRGRTQQAVALRFADVKSLVGRIIRVSGGPKSYFDSAVESKPTFWATGFAYDLDNGLGNA